MSKIPQEARNRLNQIANEADEASLLASRCVGQINGLQKQTAVINDAVELKAALAEIARLNGVKAGHQGLARELSALATSLGHYLRSQPAGAVLELVPAARVELLKDETTVDAVGRIRNQIEELHSERSKARQARLPKAALKERVAAHVAERARRGAPRINVAANGLEVDFGATTFAAGSVRHMVDVMCWLDAAKVQKRIESAIDAMPDAGQSMTADERTTRLADIEASLDSLERAEESLIRLCEEAGHKAIARRQHASPAAILGVRIKTDKAARSRAA